jgi:Bacterial EndoU nuclease
VLGNPVSLTDLTGMAPDGGGVDDDETEEDRQKWGWFSWMRNKSCDQTDCEIPSVRITDRKAPSKFWTNTRAFLKGAALKGAKIVFPLYGAWEGIKDAYGSVTNWVGSVSRLVEGQGSWRDVAVSVGLGEAPAVVDLATGLYNGEEAAYEELGGVVWDVAAGATVGVEIKATNLTPQGGFVSLVDSKAAGHILAGDATGGGYGWTSSLKSFSNGLLGKKSMFPLLWSEQKILHAASDVVSNNPWVQQTGRAGSLVTRNGQPVKFVVEGYYDGIKIKVVATPDRIITAYPIK